MSITLEMLPGILKKAVAASACEPPLTTLRRAIEARDVTILLTHPAAPEWAYWYACNVIKGRWREAEPLIMTNPYLAYGYARRVIKERWLEAEPLILTSPKVAYWYARRVIKERWLEAEPGIMTDPYLAPLYAFDVIKGRWLEAEPVIMTSLKWASLYVRFIKGAGLRLSHLSWETRNRLARTLCMSSRAAGLKRSRSS